MGQLVFQATLGGQVNLVGPNTASTFNLNVPATSSTIATLTGTETFTNKTLTSPTLTTPVLGTPSSGTLTNCTGLPNAGLTNSSVTVGSTSIALGATATTIAGLTSLATNTLTSASATALTLQSAGTTAITVDTSQYVGIGTISPLGKLQVSGVTQAATSGYGQINAFSTDAIGADKGGKISFGGVSGASGFDPYGFCAIAGYKDNATASNFSGYLTFSTSTSGGTVTERMRITSAGNVGIGTNSPNAKLHVNNGSSGGASSYFTDSTTGTSSGFQVGLDSGHNAILNMQYNAQMLFSTNNTERARIDSSGNLLVGTTSVNYLGAGFTLSGNSGTTNWMCGPRSSAPNEFVISAASSFGVYLTSTSATSWTSASDERLKENLVPIENGLTKVCSLRSVTGNFIADEEKTKRPFLIAQDVQAVLPEAVSITPSGEYLGISYSEVIPLLVASIKELKAINVSLTARIVALESK